MKTGVSSYSFKDYLRGEVSIYDVIKKAKEIGYEEIEFVDFNRNLPENESIMEHAAKVRELCKETGIAISAYTCGADFINGSGGDPAEEARRVKGLVDITAVLGAKKMRHDATYGGKNCKLTYIQAVDKIAPYIRDVTEYAESKGVKTMTENHGHFIQDSYRVEYLISKVDHPNYGVLIDIGNFICVDECPLQAVSRLAPLAFHVHAKDFKYKKSNGAAPPEGWGRSRGGNALCGTIVGQGDMPVVQCLQLIKRAGYEGSLGLEFEGREENIRGLVEGYSFLKKTLCEILSSEE